MRQSIIADAEPSFDPQTPVQRNTRILPSIHPRLNAPGVVPGMRGRVTLESKGECRYRKKSRLHQFKATKEL